MNLVAAALLRRRRHLAEDRFVAIFLLFLLGRVETKLFFKLGSDGGGLFFPFFPPAGVVLELFDA